MQPSQKGFRGLPLNMCLLMMIVLALGGQSAESIVSSAEKDTVDRGFEAGKEILNCIKEKDFTKTLTKIAASTAPFLGAIGPFIGFVLAFIPTGDSAELAFMKDMMKNIDNKFDQVDGRFNEIERLINWVQVAVNFGQIQQNIRAVRSVYKSLYSGAQTVSENRKNDFIVQYESVYQLSGLKLYQALVEQQGAFTESLGRSVIRYTKYDRKKTRDFLLGILELIYEATEIELAYYAAKQYNEILEDRKATWVNRILELKNKYEELDRAVKDEFKVQIEADAKEISSKQNDNFRFALQTYDMLKKKYYWRDWCVIVWDQNIKMYGDNCGGVKVLGHNGRDFIISSVDSTKPKMSPAEMKSRLQSIGKYAYWQNWAGLRWPRDPKQVYDKINKSGACSTVVVNRHKSIHGYGGWGNPQFVSVTDHYQHLYMFG